MTHRPTRRSLLAAGAALILAGCGVPATEPAVRRRTIPFGLWAGDMAATPDRPVRITRGEVTIAGPVDWVHPATGETLKVWERARPSAEGPRLQRFALRPDGQALGRVFDSRPGRPDRVFLGDAFFPLGDWSEGESREFPMTEIAGEARTEFVATLTVVELDREFRGVPGSLRHDWTLRDAAGQVVFSERFDHVPGEGLARFRNLLA